MTKEAKTRSRRLTLPMPERVRVEVERVINVLGLPRKAVVEAAAGIAAEAVMAGLASRLGKARIEAAEAELARLRDALDAKDARSLRGDPADTP